MKYLFSLIFLFVFVDSLFSGNLQFKIECKNNNNISLNNDSLSTISSFEIKSESQKNKIFIVRLIDKEKNNIDYLHIYQSNNVFKETASQQFNE